MVGVIEDGTTDAPGWVWRREGGRLLGLPAVCAGLIFAFSLLAFLGFQMVSDRQVFLKSSPMIQSDHYWKGTGNTAQFKLVPLGVLKNFRMCV